MTIKTSRLRRSGRGSGRGSGRRDADLISIKYH
jgi:hypothetical protein